MEEGLFESGYSFLRSKSDYLSLLNTKAINFYNNNGREYIIKKNNK